ELGCGSVHVTPRFAVKLDLPAAPKVQDSTAQAAALGTLSHTFRRKPQRGLTAPRLGSACEKNRPRVGSIVLLVAPRWGFLGLGASKTPGRRPGLSNTTPSGSSSFRSTALSRLRI